MEINFKNIQADQEAQAKSVARDEHNAKVWSAILDQFLIADVDCNYGIVLDWCGGRVLTFEAVADLIRSKRSTPTLVTTSREELATEIVDQMTHKSDWDKRQFKLRLSTYSLKQLRDLLRKFRAQAAIKTAAQAREVLKEAGPKPPRWPGVAQMLPKTFIRETFSFVPTHVYLFQLASTAKRNDSEGSMAAYTLKKLCRLHGSPQVDWYIEKGRAAAEAEALSND
jgi:hypothetical protein